MKRQKHIPFILVGMTLIGLSCGKSRLIAPAGTKPVSSDVVIPDPIIPVPDVPVPRQPTEWSTLDLLPKKGSRLRMIEPQGLAVYYSHVFPKADHGFQQCKGIGVLRAADCHDSIFSALERLNMGSFEINTVRSGRGGQNVGFSQGLTLNYMRTLRAALTRECTALVTSEYAALAAGSADANVLVKSLSAPTAEHFNGFFRKLLGVNEPSFKLDVDAEKYAQAFLAMYAASEKKEATARLGFTTICVSLAMDPQIIFY